MDSYYKFLIVLFILVCLKIISGASEKNLDQIESPPEMECKEGVAYMFRRQLRGAQNCTKKMGITDAKEKAARFPCIQKCIYINEGVLLPDGKPDKGILGVFLKAEIPKNLYMKAKTLVESCFDEHQSKFDHTEESCKSYVPFNKCLHEGIPKLILVLAYIGFVSFWFFTGDIKPYITPI